MLMSGTFIFPMRSWGGASKPKHEMVQEYWAEEGMGMGMMPKNYISISDFAMARSDLSGPTLAFCAKTTILADVSEFLAFPPTKAKQAQVTSRF